MESNPWMTKWTHRRISVSNNIVLDTEFTNPQDCFISGFTILESNKYPYYLNHSDGFSVIAKSILIQVHEKKILGQRNFPIRK